MEDTIPATHSTFSQGWFKHHQEPPSSGHFLDPNLRSSEVCVRIRPLSSDEAVWVGNIPMGGLLLECCLGEVMTFSYEKDVVAIMEMVAGLC